MPKRPQNSKQVEQLNLAVEAMLAGRAGATWTGEDARRSIVRTDQDAGGSVVRTGGDARAYIAGTDAGALMRIAGELCELPRKDFKERLKADLLKAALEERSISMTTATLSPATRVFAAPRMTFKDVAKAMEFYNSAFGANETFRFQTGPSIGHAEMTIGDSVIMFSEEWPAGNRYSAETLGNSPIMMSIQVADVDAFVDRAVAAGATLVLPPSDQFYGYRDATMQDPFGYKWSVRARIEEMSVEEMHRRFRAAMPEQKTPETPRISPVPKGYRTLTPYIVAQDADGLVGFVKTTFGAEETFRSAGGSGGGLHCEVKLGDSMMMIGGGGPELAWKGDSNPGAFHVYVSDCDAAYQRAIKAGATSIQPPTDQPYGERSGSVKDAAGNHWYIATRSQGNYKWEGAPDVQPYLHPRRAEPVINFLKRAFGAEDLGRFASSDGVIQHVTMKIDDSHIEMGESQGPYQPMNSMFYLYVPDCDAVYKRALDAGATSISEPKDQSYGDRSGGVKDVFGNQWYIATHIKDMTP
jgi:PhnB protein